MAYLHINFRSSCITRSVYPMVFLPDLNGWQDLDPPYPTLYFLHGYSGGGLETAMFTNFALFSMRYGVAIVLVDGENSFYLDDEKRGALFSRFVGEELVEVTRSVLPLSPRREDTWLAGISMGGYGALINGLRFSRQFSRVGLLSPALGFKRPDDSVPEGCPVPAGELLETFGPWQTFRGSYRDERAALRRAAENPENLPGLFLAAGRQDALYPEALRLRDFCRQLNVPLAWYEAEGGHDHTFWKQALDPLLCFLTGKEGA